MPRAASTASRSVWLHPHVGVGEDRRDRQQRERERDVQELRAAREERDEAARSARRSARRGRRWTCDGQERALARVAEHQPERQRDHASPGPSRRRTASGAPTAAAGCGCRRPATPRWFSRELKMNEIASPNSPRAAKVASSRRRASRASGASARRAPAGRARPPAARTARPRRRRWSGTGCRRRSPRRGRPRRPGRPARSGRRWSSRRSAARP